ncbi:flavin reductase family protein [Actinophytocola glycyrrhizae]|uniref:Flavin reductase family protein n=1 Tax=Actinophytocola glycyrrhizae TaxID=2044873 RepID=A0ABV9RUQ6_9PSEU
MSTFCTGVTVITAVGRDGTPHGLTCTSLASVTVSPPTLMVCLDVRSGTLAAVRDSGRFAVNLLHEGGRRAAEVFSSAVPDRFDQVPWRLGETGQLWLVEDAFAVAECRVADAVVVGDHVVVFGEVVNTEQRAETPLLYGMRRFASWEGASATTERVP